MRLDSNIESNLSNNTYLNIIKIFINSMILSRCYYKSSNGSFISDGTHIRGGGSFFCNARYEVVSKWQFFVSEGGPGVSIWGKHLWMFF